MRSMLVLGPVLLATGCAADGFGRHRPGTVPLTATDRAPESSRKTSGLFALRSGPGSATLANFCQITAEEYAAAGRTAEAIAMFEQAQSHDPSLADRNAHRLAVLHAAAGHIEQARVLFRKAEAVDPRSADLHSDLGWFLLSQNELPEAEARLRTALELQPGHPRAMMNLGLAATRRGDLETAETCFAGVIGRDAARENIALLTRNSQRSRDLARAPSDGAAAPAQPSVP